MRNVTSIETPNLFGPVVQEEPERPVKTTDGLARDFVKWCWSVGDDFRNSPDITNFRFWQQKNKTRISSPEEDEILLEARRLFLKKVEQAVRKADVPKDPA